MHAPIPAATSADAIRFEDVTCTFPGARTPAVRDLSLVVTSGELLVLLGESGCGKTTTLKLVNRLVEPSAGRVLVDGQDVSRVDPVRLRRGIGYVFQRIGLFPHMTVGDNVAVVPRLLGWPPERVAPRVDELLAMVGLDPDEHRGRRPDALSGGQAQRVGVARALAGDPAIVLMDEPFGALDPLTRKALQDDYRALHDTLGLTTVLVTHDMTEALLMADRIAVMKDGQLLQIGTPRALLEDPAHADVARLLGTPLEQAAAVEAVVGRVR